MSDHAGDEWAGAVAGVGGALARWVKTRKVVQWANARDRWASFAVAVLVGAVTGIGSMAFLFRTQAGWSFWEVFGVAFGVGLVSGTVADFAIRMVEGLTARAERTLNKRLDERFGPDPGAPANGQPPAAGTQPAGGPPQPNGHAHPAGVPAAAADRADPRVRE